MSVVELSPNDSVSTITLPPLQIGDTVVIRPDVASLHTSYSKGSYVWANQPYRLKFLDNKPHTITHIIQDNQYILDNDNSVFWIREDFYRINPDIVVSDDHAGIAISSTRVEDSIGMQPLYKKDEELFDCGKLYKALENYVGQQIYHVMFGNVTIKKVSDKGIVVADSTGKKYNLRTDGKYVEGGDVVIYPSSTQRDWCKWWLENVKPNITHKTWSEFAEELVVVPVLGQYDREIDQTHFTLDETELNSVDKSAMAFLKILSLIDHSYGGIVTTAEWNNMDENAFYTIVRDRFNTELRVAKCASRQPIAFHTRVQAKEFISHSENVSLFMTYNCITE